MKRNISSHQRAKSCRDKDTRRTEKRSDVSRTEQEKNAGLNEDKLRHRIGSLSYMQSRAGHNREHNVVVNEAKTELYRSRVIWTGYQGLAYSAASFMAGVSLRSGSATEGLRTILHPSWHNLGGHTKSDPACGGDPIFLSPRQVT